MQVERDDRELSIQGIEKKRDGSFVVRVEVPENTNKGEIERSFRDRYDAEVKLLEAVYREKLQAKEREIEIYKEKSADIMELAKLAASRPIHNINNAEAKAMIENQSKYTEVEMNVSGGQVTGIAGKVMGNQINAKANLADSAAEIQQLLRILDRSYPPDIPEKTRNTIAVAVEGIDRDPALKERAIGALKAGGMEALKELTDNPYVNILLATYEGWREPQ